MGVQLNGVRLGTLLGLYDSLGSHRTAREDRDVLERALDLVLNMQREAASVAYLRRNVIRNARFSILRSAASAQRAAAARPLPDAIHRRVTWRSTEGSDHVELIDNGTPESIALVSETVAELKEFAKSLGAHGAACLDGLLAGATAAETAAYAGTSVPTVERCWRRIRQWARELLAVSA